MPGGAAFIRIGKARKALVAALEKHGKPVEEKATFEAVVKAAAKALEEAAENERG